MKRIYLISLIFLLSLGLRAGLWETLTNTSHIYDLQVSGGVVHCGTWGGAIQLMPYNTNLGVYYEQSKLWTTGDGIVSNDIRKLALIGNNLWLGSSDRGISIVNQLGIQSLGLDLGLPALKINDILQLEDRILVASSGGLAEYYYLPEVNFPLILHQYTRENTSDGLASNNVTAIQSLGDYIYLGTDAGLSYVHRDSLNVDAAWQKWQAPFTGNELKLASGGGKLLVGFGFQIYRSSGLHPDGNWQVLTNPSGQTISAVGMQPDGTAWVAYGSWNENLSSFSTSGDILFSTFDPAGLRTDFSKDQDGLGSNTITDFAFDDTDIYLASWGDGFYRQSYNDWISFETNSIGFPRISAIAADDQQYVWFASGYIDSQPVKKGSLGISYIKGGQWEAITMANSPLHNDSAHCLAVDSNNRIWFGAWDTPNNHPLGWKNGITIFDRILNKWWRLSTEGMREWNAETQNWSALLPGKASLASNTIGGLSVDTAGRILVAAYDRGVDVINPDYTLHSRFTLPNSTRQRVIYSYHNGSQYFFGTNNDNGLVIWNHPSVPVSNGEHWIVPSPPEIATCIVYGVATVESPNEGRQHWLLLSSGVFMWDEQNWYKYDTSIKRYRYSNGSWINDQLYFVDEERLFASVRGLPTSMYQDPFGRIWIGFDGTKPGPSGDEQVFGVSMYNPRTDRFTNYYSPKNPMLNAKITAMGYEPVNGLLYIGTTDGVNTLKVGRYIKPDTQLQTLQAFPNPFRPAQDGLVQIANLPTDSMPQGSNRCRIYDSSGALVIELEENEFARFSWDGRNRNGSPVSSGIYYYVVSNADGSSARGKLALIR